MGTAMFDHFRHISLRTRLALGTLLPLGLATMGVAVAWVPAMTSPVHATHYALLLSAALLCLAIGTGLLLLQTNVRSLERPLEDAGRLTPGADAWPVRCPRPCEPAGRDRPAAGSAGATR